jgi:hypothetical protein
MAGDIAAAARGEPHLQKSKPLIHARRNGERNERASHMAVRELCACARARDFSRGIFPARETHLLLRLRDDGLEVVALVPAGVQPLARGHVPQPHDGVVPQRHTAWSGVSTGSLESKGTLIRFYNSTGISTGSLQLTGISTGTSMVLNIQFLGFHGP